MASETERLQELLSAFFLWVNKDTAKQKYVFKFERGKVHYTIRIWNDDRTLDFHRTDENFPIGDPKRHEQFFRISFYSIARVLVALKNSGFEQMLPRLMLRSKINVGKLKRNNSLLVPLDPNNAAFDGFIKVFPRPSGQKSIRLNALQDFSSVNEFVWPEDALSHPVQSFTVYQFRRGFFRMRGHVYRYPNSKLHGHRSFIYFTNEMRRNWMKQSALLFYQILKSIHFQNKEKVLNYMQDQLLETYMRNHPLVKNANRNSRKT